MKAESRIVLGTLAAFGFFGAAARAVPVDPPPSLTQTKASPDSVKSTELLQYSVASEQVTSISQFTYVHPSDWAYQALSNLLERHGCVAGYPSSTFGGSRLMTRYEAAALLNACLDSVSEVTDELRRLLKEFDRELAVLRGRVDGLEAKVGELEATQFATTTKLTGRATMVLGGNRYFGSSGSGVTQISDGRQVATGGGYKQAAQALQGAVSFNYDVQLKLATSFTGKDSLITVLRAGNFQNSPYGGQYGVNDVTNGFVGLNELAVQFQEPPTPNVLSVNRLYYQFPVSKTLTATVGGIVRQDDMLAFWPSVYSDNAILNFFSFAGAPGAYNNNLGPGAGLWWSKEKLRLSFNYVVSNGNVGNPSTNLPCSSDPSPKGGSDFNNSTYTPNPENGGIGNCASTQTMTVQVGYQDQDWGVAAAYTNSSGNFQRAIASGTPYAVDPHILRTVQNWTRKAFNSFALGGYWQPSTSGWVPSVSVGWGINQAQPVTGIFGYNSSDVDQAGLGNLGDIFSQSWSVGLVWDDVFLKGNSAGMGFGQPTFVTSSYRGNRAASPGLPSPVQANDATWAWEWWYNYQVSDNLTVTPAIYYLNRPLGQITDNVNLGADWFTPKNFSIFGAIVKTTFRF